MGKHKRSLSRKRTLTVHRGGYTKRGGTHVSPTTYQMKDLGKKGKGEKTLPEVEEGKMTTLARRGGYIQEDQTISDMTTEEIKDFATDLINEVGAEEARGMFQWQINIRKGRRDPDVVAFREKMQAAVNAIKSMEKPKFSKTTIHPATNIDGTADISDADTNRDLIKIRELKEEDGKIKWQEGTYKITGDASGSVNSLKIHRFSNKEMKYEEKLEKMKERIRAAKSVKQLRTLENRIHVMAEKNQLKKHDDEDLLSVVYDRLTEDFHVPEDEL